MNNLVSTLAKKAQENLEKMQFLVEDMKKAASDEKRIELLIHFMHLSTVNRRLISEALTDNELEIVKNDIGEEWDMWKKINTAEGAKAPLKHYMEKEEEN